MEKITSKLRFLAMIGMAMSAIFYLQSCSKSDNNNGGTPPPPLIGGYVSSDSVAAANLIAYWPFDGDANDHKGSGVATTNRVTFNTGMRGQAYQGDSGAYATLAPNSAFSSLSSYSFSVWYKLAAQPNDGDPGGIFFLSGNTNLNEMIYEIEHYAPVSGDSVRIHTGFNDLGSPAYQLFVMEAFDTFAINKWVHLVTTYDAGSSTYVVYQNGVPINNNSAFGLNASTVLYTDGTKTTPLGPLSFASDPPSNIILGTWPATLFGVSPSLGANGSFRGQLDEMRVFNRALSQQEVAGLFLNGQAGR